MPLSEAFRTPQKLSLNGSIAIFHFVKGEI